MLRHLLAAVLVVAAAVVVAPAARADIICRTDPGSGYSYTYCHGTDSWGNRYDTVTICYRGSDYCTTRDVGG